MPDISSAIMLGITLASLLVVCIISFLYFPKKRLNSSAGPLFSLLVHFAFFNILLDSITYCYEVGFIEKHAFFMPAIFYLYTLSSIFMLVLITNYTYVMTYGRTHHLSKFFLYGSAVPFWISFLGLTYHFFAGNMVASFDGITGITVITYRILILNYILYSLINIVLLLFFRRDRDRKITQITNALAILQGVVLIVFAEHYMLFIESLLLMVDILLVFVVIQYPKDNIDHQLGIFDQRALHLMFEDYEAKQENFYMITIDFVEFKYYVAKYGIDVANKMLMKMTTLLPDDSKTTSSYRYENDIFIILTTDTNLYQRIIEYWKHSLTQSWYIDGIKLDVAFVVTHFYKDYNFDSENMVLFLERLMTFEKQQLGSRFVFVNDRKELMNREYLVLNAIRDAIKNYTFEVFFQPVFNMKTKKFDHCEALARLSDERVGAIPPDEFIRIAEKNGLIRDVSQQIISKTICYMDQYQFLEKGIESVNINLSSLELGDSEVLHYIEKTLASFQLTNKSLTLEITESEETTENMESTIFTLHNKGFQLALDDYGTGYSNMDRILSLPFTYIKIDKSMLYLSEDNMKKRILLQKNIEMLRDCGYVLVVEGVETKEQADSLALLNVDYIQGYYYSRPLPVKEFIKKITE